MAQVKPFKFDTDGFPIEMDGADDDLIINSLTVDSGIAMGASLITGLAPGVAGTDAVNLSQLQSVAAGFDPKGSVRVRTILDMSTWTPAGAGVGATLTAPTDAASFNTVDGVLLALGERVLVPTAADAAGAADVENGIYTVTALGDGAGTSFELTRAIDFDEDSEVTAGAFTFVTEGTTWADTGWYVVTDDAIIVDTTAIQWSQFAGVGTFTGGDGIDITAGVITVDLGVDPGLEFVSNALEVLVDPAGAIQKVAAGIGVILEATDPSLQIVANELGVKFGATTSGLAKNAAGLQVVTDGVTIQINGSGELEVIGGGTVDQYSLTAGAGGVSIGDPIYISANDTGLPTDNTNNNTRRYAGVAAATVAAAASFAVQQEGVITPASIGGSPTAGDIVWAATPSGLTVVLPTGTGTHRMVIGKMKNATDVIIEPQYISKID